MTSKPTYFVTPACGPYGARINLGVGVPDCVHRQMALLSIWRSYDKTFQVVGSDETFHSYEVSGNDLAVGKLLLEHQEIPEMQRDDFSLTLRH